jgi:hypothetical protein
MDAARQLAQLLDGGLRLLARLRDELGCGLRIGLEPLLGEAERDGHRDHPLLRTVVQVALDPPPLGVGRREDALARAAQVVDPVAQRSGAPLLGRFTGKANLGPHQPPG